MKSCSVAVRLLERSACLKGAYFSISYLTAASQHPVNFKSICITINNEFLLSDNSNFYSFCRTADFFFALMKASMQISGKRAAKKKRHYIFVLGALWQLQTHYSGWVESIFCAEQFCSEKNLQYCTEENSSDTASAFKKNGNLEPKMFHGFSNIYVLFGFASDGRQRRGTLD